MGRKGVAGRVGSEVPCMAGSGGWGQRCCGQSEVCGMRGMRVCVVGGGAGDCGGYAVVSQLYALFLRGVHSPEMEADFGDLLNVPGAQLRGTAWNVRKRLALLGKKHVAGQKKHIPANVLEVRRRSS